MSDEMPEDLKEKWNKMDKEEEEKEVDNRPPFMRVKIFRNRHIIADLFKIIGKDGFICGGFARYCCSPLPLPVPSDDIDIYCYTEESFKALNSRLEGNKDFKKGKESPASITFRKAGLPKIQLIKTLKTGHVVLQGTPEEVIGNFDFTIARVAIISARKAIADKDFLKHEKRHKLVIRNIHCPLAQVYRISKYVSKGYWISTLQVLHVFSDWENRDADYRQQLVDKLNTKDLSKEDVNELEALLHID